MFNYREYEVDNAARVLPTLPPSSPTTKGWLIGSICEFVVLVNKNHFYLNKLYYEASIFVCKLPAAKS